MSLPERCGCEHSPSGPVCTACAAAPIEPSAAAVKAGDVLEGKWRVDRKLGQGGMGTVVQATDLELRRSVAVKLLLPHLCADPTAVSRFEREARATAALEHPNLVPIYSVGCEGDRPFMVMKLLQGRPLSLVLKEGGRLAREVVLSIVTQLASALDYVHGRGMVHRDVKPANIFLGPDGHVTLLDFGVFRDGREATLTKPGQVIGSISHIAPELLRSNAKPDHRADIYSLGAVLFELLTGAPPFDAADARIIARMHLSAPPPDPRAEVAALPSAVSRVVRQALDKNPDKRPATAGALARALEHAWPLNAPLRRGRGKLWAVLGALAMLIGVGAVAGRLGSEKRPPPPSLRETPPSVTVLREAPTSATVLHEAPPSATVSAVPVLPPAEKVRIAQAPSPVATTVPKLRRKPAPPRPQLPRSAPEPVLSRSEPAPAAEGSLSVVTLSDGKPTWANLTVDGVARGTTPLAFKAPVGVRRIRVERTGFLATEVEATVKRGPPTVLQLELRR
jgi:serine/threonine-protein kinase